MTEINMAEKIDEILCLTEEWSPEIVQTEGCKNHDIKLTSESGREMFITFAEPFDNEISIYCDDWHDHYNIDRLNEYEILIADLLGILRNEKYTVCLTRVGEWCGSSLWTGTPDEAVLRKEFGSDKTIACTFWDSSKNVIFKETAYGRD